MLKLIKRRPRPQFPADGSKCYLIGKREWYKAKIIRHIDQNTVLITRYLGGFVEDIIVHPSRLDPR